MKLTKEVENALAGLAALAVRPPGAVMLSADLADAAGASAAFMSKIMQRLAAGAIVAGHRGNPRGYSLARPAERISVCDVIETLEGKDVFERCVFWSETCSERRACQLHSVWKHIRPQVKAQFSALTVRDLAEKRRGRR